MIRLTTGKKVKNFSDRFLVDLMDVDMDQKQFYSLLEVVDKTYNNTNDLSNSPKIK